MSKEKIIERVQNLVERKGGHEVRDLAMLIHSRLIGLLHNKSVNDLFSQGYVTLAQIPKVNISVGLAARELITDRWDINPELVPRKIEFSIRDSSGNSGSSSMTKVPPGQYNTRTGTISFTKMADDLGFIDQREYFREVKSQRGLLSDIMEDMEDVFIHEYIHFHDDVIRPEMFDTMKRHDSKGEYFNHPVELNAYFQQGMSRIQKHMHTEFFEALPSQSDDPEWDLSVLLLPPKNRRVEQYLHRYMHTNWLEKLTKKNKKRIKKRLYTAITDVQDELKERLRTEEPDLYNSIF